MSTQVTADTLITIKANHNGQMCRFKLPLRDMHVSALEEKLRANLNIDSATECTFERYSDSASAFVILDRANVSVYKQLYRAAKAKQRLKIKVTTLSQDDPVSEPNTEKTGEKEQPQEENKIPDVEVQPSAQPSAQVPKPVSVEDEPEPPSASPSEMTEIPKAEPTHMTKPLVTNCVPLPAPVNPVSFASTPACGGYPHTLSDTDFSDFRYMTGMNMKPCPLDSISNAAPIQSSQQTETPPARPPKETFSVKDAVYALRPLVPTGQCPKFAVCCNKCDVTIPEAHYHCQTCDDGDFDLCQSCVDQGATCHSSDHWLIKRFVRGGQIINSQTEKVSPKPKIQHKPVPIVPAPPFIPKPWPKPLAKAAKIAAIEAPAALGLTPTKPPGPPIRCGRCRLSRSVCACDPRPLSYPPVLDLTARERLAVPTIRTCNSCVQEFSEPQFLHCMSCEDYDLCKDCFLKDNHGHHPAHAFEAAVKNDVVEPMVKARLAPGRNKYHKAICDGCDKTITGVRHKCLDCPDWDYCSECVLNAGFVHADHRFVPIYDDIKSNLSRTVHVGIFCDGPICSTTRGSGYVVGVRYKCAVCNDTDFCSNCEASPSNTHNKTHPLIKFKTPVRHVTVTTTADKRDGEAPPTLGDRTRNSTSSRATSTTAAANNSSTAIQTVVNVKPAEAAPEPKPVETLAKVELPRTPTPAPEPVAIPNHEGLDAVYVRDIVVDGTIMPPNTVFNQTWVIKNAGTVAWPASCSLKYVGGDYMGHLDPSHPAGVRDLVSANESTVCYQPLEPGKEFAFNVLLRTPSREGKTISYWRLTTPDGHRFGHRLWCDVMVVTPQEKMESAVKVEQAATNEASPKVEKKIASPSESQMIFPTLEKESPVSSMYEEANGEPIVAHHTNEREEGEDFEELAEDDEWDDDESFNTDEEYDLLDASDEECSEVNGQAAQK